MPASEWHECFDLLAPLVVQITTPGYNQGTGFLAARSDSGEVLGVATSTDVIEYTYRHNTPMTWFHATSGVEGVIAPGQRSILTSSSSRTAVILVRARENPLSEAAPKLTPSFLAARKGTEVGWLGYANVAARQLSFYRGVVSCFLKESASYLIDGRILAGMSGSPVFTRGADGTVSVAGLLTGYVPTQGAPGAPGHVLAAYAGALEKAVERVRTFEEASGRTAVALQLNLEGAR